MGSNMYSLVISNDSTVYSFGYNAGQLGLGDTDERNVPTLIPSLSNVKQVSCGQIHSLALLNDGTVYAFGINNAGQLGLGDTDDRNVPTLIPSLSNVKQVSCGFAFSLALLNDGTVYAFGSNSYGELGLGNDCRTPTLIPSLSNVKQVSCAAEHSLVLLNDGTVYALGHNNYGQLGLGDNNDRNVPTLIPSLSNVKQVYCSYEHSLVLLENGTVYAFGYNSFGQLGLGDTNNRNVPTLIPSLSNVKQISCGYDFSLALLNDGTVYGFGDNYDGDLGLGNDTNGKCIPTLIPSLSNVKQISCGYEHSLALLNNGDVYTFGHNDNGQLGLGDTNDRDVPTLIPSLSNVKYLWDIIIPDTIIIDTDVYTESEKEFSMRDAIIKLIEWKRFNTEKKIDIHQKGLLPEFLNLTWNKDDLYFKNGVYQVSRYYKETCLHINGIRNNILFDESKNRYFCEKMADAYNKGIVQPFLLFVNKIHIPWSKITIVRSDFYISFLISDMNKKYQIDDVQILHIPFNITYTENIDEDATKQILFKFNANGLFNMDNSIFVYADNDNIKVNVYDDGSYTNFDMNISYKRKLTSANLVIFDSDGKLYRDAAILIKNANILTTNGNYVVCCYNTLSNANEANAVRALNEPFEKTLINESVTSNRLDLNTLLSDFNFEYDSSLSYQQNIENALKYIMGYDENKLDKIFEMVKLINIIEYNATNLITRFDKEKSVTMLRDVYEGNNLTSFPIIFHNGIVPSYYKDIVYKQDSFTFIPTGLNNGDKFEIVYFKGISNELIKLDLNNKNKSDYLNIKNCYIPREDLVVYSACKGEDNLYPLNYTIDNNDNIILKNPKYLGLQLYLGSKRQFIYEQFTTSSDTNVINLSNKFRTAYNEKKFMVFINGEYIDSMFYRVLIPSLNNDKITKRTIYIMKTISPSDRVDIFYCPNANMSKIISNGDLIVQCIRSKVIHGTKRFKVPYPYLDYPRTYDSFFCLKHSAYIDKAEYTIDGDYIDFSNSSYTVFDELIFVFPYYKPDWIYLNDPTNDDIEQFVTRYNRTTAQTNQIIFPSGVEGDVTTDSAIYLFIGSTYIDPSRYEITAPNTVTFLNETIPSNKNVALVMELSKYNDTVSLEVLSATAIVNNQINFDISLPDYYESFFIIKNSVLVDPSRYYISTDGRSIQFIDSTNYIVKDDKLLFIFTKTKSTPPSNTHIEMEFINIPITQNCTSVAIPANYYYYLDFSSENMLLFYGSTYFTSNRYSITNNIITLNDTTTNFKIGRSITIAFAHRVVDKIDKNIDDYNDIIKFQDIEVEAETDGQTKFEIPYPSLVLMDSPFIITVGDTFIGPNRYTSDGTYITLDSYTPIKRGNSVRFTFIHNDGLTHIYSKQVTIDVSIGQTEVSIPSPFTKTIDLSNRMIVLYGSVYLDKSRYRIDNRRKKILLTDLYINRPNTMTFIFFYTGCEDNGIAAYLSQSGYVCFNKKEIDRNFNKEMFMMFINGKIVYKSELLDITNSMFKVCKDIGRRYDLVTLNCSPLISETKSKYTISEWNNMINKLPV